METKISIDEILNLSFQRWKENLGFLVGLTVIYFLTVFIASIIVGGILQFVFSFLYPSSSEFSVFSANNLSSTKILISFLVQLILQAVIIVFHLGFLKSLIKISKGEEAKISDIFSCFPLFLKAFALYFLLNLILIPAFLFFIIPGIILSARLGFSYLFLLEEKIDPIEALKRSFKATDRNTLRIILLFFLAGIISAIGAFAFFIGMIFTFPFSSLMLVSTYLRYLKKEEIDQQEEKAPQGSLESQEK